MGLDVAAYKNLTVVATCDPSDEERYDELRGRHTRFYVNPAFPGREGCIREHTFYDGDYIDGPSMAYSYYSRWREQLAELVGAEPKEYLHMNGFTRTSRCVDYWFNDKQGPFAEQINFSDCEGVIGPVVMTKLAKDYAEWDKRASTHGDQWLYDIYRKFHNCFAQNEGLCAVEFH